MAAKQGVILKRVAVNNSNAKYKLKYTYRISQTATNGLVKTKYSYSKLITPIKKYSYAI